MKGIIHSDSRITGKLKEEIQKLVWEANLSYSEYKPLNKYYVEERLHLDQLSLNGAVSLVDKLGYYFKIELIKR